jgi:glycosyltransferase involved in cell wall biosynthesis
VLDPVKFSIIIPCFNDWEYAIEAVDSCLRQVDAPTIEIIVVDDGSSDGSCQHLLEYHAGDPRVSVIRQQNQGPSAARNNGLRQASGSHIVFLDADDKIGPLFLSMITKAIRDEPASINTLIASAFIYFKSDEEHHTYSGMRKFQPPKLTRHIHSINRFLLLTGNCFPISSCVIPKLLIEKIGAFDPALSHHEDWDFWIRVISETDAIRYIAATPEAATYIRERNGQMSERTKMHHSLQGVLERHATRGFEQCLRSRMGWVLGQAIRLIASTVQRAIGANRLNLTSIISSDKIR